MEATLSHPHNEHRDHKVQKSRVAHITRGYASGGAVNIEHEDEKEDKALIKKTVKKTALRMTGGKVTARLDRRARGGKIKVKPRADGGASDDSWEAPMTAAEKMNATTRRWNSTGKDDTVGGILSTMGQALKEGWGGKTRAPLRRQGEEGLSPHQLHEKRGGRIKRARGGRTKHAKTNVNVIVAPQGAHPGAPGMAPGGPPMPPPMGMPPHPPMAPPPMAGPPGMPPGGPGGMPMMPPPGAGPGIPPPIRHSGGRTYAKGGAVKSGPAWGTGIKAMTPIQHSPGKGDGANIGRPKPITYKSGGRIDAPDGVAPATKLPGGSGGGLARLEKERREARR